MCMCVTVCQCVYCTVHACYMRMRLQVLGCTWLVNVLLVAVIRQHACACVCSVYLQAIVRLTSLSDMCPSALMMRCPNRLRPRNCAQHCRLCSAPCWPRTTRYRSRIWRTTLRLRTVVGFRCQFTKFLTLVAKQCKM